MYCAYCYFHHYCRIFEVTHYIISNNSGKVYLFHPPSSSHELSHLKSVQDLIHNDRDIILLPNSFKDECGLIKIPRGKASRECLAANGLVGRICLSTNMTELHIFDEIRSIFRSPMNEDMEFSIRILQMSGGGSKTLTIPVVSSTYKWTASAVAGKNAKCPIYVLANDLDLISWN